MEFLRLPDVERQLFTVAEWHDKSDIHLTFCKTFVRCCQEGLIRLEREQWSFDLFARHARLYERHTGKLCADLIYRLDGMMCSLSMPPSTNGIQHWTGRFVDVCHPEWIGPEAQALIFFMALHGLTLFVERAIRTLSDESQTSIHNDLLRTLLLGGYHPTGFILSYTPDPLAIEFLCSKGANVNSIARKASTSVTGCNAVVEADHFQIAGCTKSQTESELDAGRSSNEITDCTIWEIYLQNRKSGSGHCKGEMAGRTTNVVVKLIEAGADLECRLPKGCENIHQVIIERIEAEPELKGQRLNINDSEKIRAALSKRGFAVRKPD